MAGEFKGCPFCGGEQTNDWGEPTWSGVRRWRYCVDCGAQGPLILSKRGEGVDETQGRADTAWNERDSRVAEETIRARIAALEEEAGR